MKIERHCGLAAAQKDTGWELATDRRGAGRICVYSHNTRHLTLCIRNLGNQGEFPRIMGQTGEAMEYELMPAKVKKAVTEKLMDQEKGI